MEELEFGEEISNFFLASVIQHGQSAVGDLQVNQIRAVSADAGQSDVTHHVLQLERGQLMSDLTQ